MSMYKAVPQLFTYFIGVSISTHLENMDMYVIQLPGVYHTIF